MRLWLAVRTSKSAVMELLRVAWRTVGSIVTRVNADVDAMVERLALDQVHADQPSRVATLELVTRNVVDAHHVRARHLPRQQQFLFETLERVCALRDFGAQQLDRRVHVAAGRNRRQLGGLVLELRRRRFARGALRIETGEGTFAFDGEGGVERAWLEAEPTAHALIEELMILANEQVARTLAERRVPALFRVHEQPDGSAAERLVAAGAHPALPQPPRER